MHEYENYAHTHTHTDFVLLVTTLSFGSPSLLLKRCPRRCTVIHYVFKMALISHAEEMAQRFAAVLMRTRVSIV